MQTLQQTRARHALKRIEDIKNKLNATDRKEFRAHVRNLPAMIHTNGLGQALAFYYSKPDKLSYKTLCNLLGAWLLSEGQPYAGCQTAPQNLDEAGRLLKAITEGDMYVYLQAQAEALTYLEWAKKFAEALLDDAPPATSTTPTGGREHG